MYPSGKTSWRKLSPFTGNGTEKQSITCYGSDTFFNRSAKITQRRLRQKPTVCTSFIFTPGLAVPRVSHLRRPLTSPFIVATWGTNWDMSFHKAGTGVANPTVKEEEECTLEEALLECSISSTSHRFMAQPCYKTVVRLSAQTTEKRNWPIFCQGFEAPPSEITLNAVIMSLC